MIFHRDMCTFHDCNTVSTYIPNFIVCVTDLRLLLVADFLLLHLVAMLNSVLYIHHAAHPLLFAFNYAEAEPEGIR